MQNKNKKILKVNPKPSKNIISSDNGQCQNCEMNHETKIAQELILLLFGHGKKLDRIGYIAHLRTAIMSTS